MGPTSERTFVELQPILRLTAAWQWILLVLAVAGLVFFVIWMYRRDTGSRPTGLRFMLVALRLLTIAGLVIFIMNPVLKSESQINKASRIAVLVDTSLSMGLNDPADGGEQSVSLEKGSRRRIDDVIEGIAAEGSLQRLNAEHALDIYRFGDQPQPELFASVEIADGEATPQQYTAPTDDGTGKADLAGRVAIGLLVTGLATIFMWGTGLVRRKDEESESSIRSWILATAVLLLIAGVCSLAICDLSMPHVALSESLIGESGIEPGVEESVGTPPATPPANSVVESTLATNRESQAEFDQIDWENEISPRGTATQLGTAIEYIVNKERGGPIAGIVVVTDGRNNAGVDPARAIASAANAGIPVFPVGIGSTASPRNVSVVDIQAPPRVYPGDKFKIKGLVQASGLEGQTVRVQLLSAGVDQPDDNRLEDELPVVLPEDGKAVPLEFEIAQLDEGKQVFSIRVSEVDGDLDSRDNTRSATVEIIERKTVVLLIAGGPTREFRFLRNQLFRDKDVNLHVWLQTAKAGADQEADELLFQFPQTREGMFKYDCIIAFDPDWRELDAIQAALLERWVAEKAGGMLVVAGPVYTPEWTRSPGGDDAIDIVRQLYPVSFYNQGSAQLKLGRFGGDTAFPLAFTREGRAAEYLWLGDTAADSRNNWSRFDGVFGYYAVNEPKPGANVLARFADPATSVDERLPIYLASHYYGAGRVFFQASGEMWRVRKVDTSYFSEYYLKLLRWISQGRLLRDSNRGVLLTDRDRCWMGDQVSVQAIVRDARDEPLDAASLRATVTRPDKSSFDIDLLPLPDAVREGTFSASFPTTVEGEYLVQLPLPGSDSAEVLQTTVEARIPDLEKEQPQRNDPQLQRIADRTQGYYYTGMQEWNSAPGDPVSPMNLIATQNQQIILPGTPDRRFTEKLMLWLLVFTVICLALEWTFRRLHRLA